MREQPRQPIELELLEPRPQEWLEHAHDDDAQQPGQDRPAVARGQGSHSRPSCPQRRAEGHVEQCADSWFLIEGHEVQELRRDAREDPRISTELR